MMWKGFAAVFSYRYALSTLPHLTALFYEGRGWGRGSLLDTHSLPA